MESHASLKTASAARYLSQLCKHWGHCFPVNFDAAEGRIDLPSGPCLLWADAGELRITIRAAEAPVLARMEDVVAEHLARFAFREGEVKLAWTRAWPAGSIDLDRRRNSSPLRGEVDSERASAKSG
ncbi:hypothetical protein QO010_003473 [Caulobacter ginsengisoli]|uniref:2,4-dihydroxyhept-2-ene-1,7-dioic acid aldolase n=1 Tax=Caulobacter ginsengisoli TaxID=400775 RepID=A0ABU0IUK0_9CAUL|nr:DUF2218 domain-containing protein [Caulobacter ginsengisoli]MDQ0465684.1 hypothetical protein [Caulobacter ginsengisoli]